MRHAAHRNITGATDKESGSEQDGRRNVDVPASKAYAMNTRRLRRELDVQLPGELTAESDLLLDLDALAETENATAPGPCLRRLGCGTYVATRSDGSLSS